MDTINQICEKYTLQNALDFGKAQVDPVMKIIMKFHPDLRKEAKEVKSILEGKVSFINTLTKIQIISTLKEKYPEFGKIENGKSSEEINFIREIINEDIKANRFEGRVHTRFPPEPNGYLHIGHAQSINLNYGIAVEFKGKFNLRFDDTNPITEEVEYVQSIIEDVKWLGADFEDRLFFASDYFDRLYNYAKQLIKKGLAYVDELSLEEMREQKGSLIEPGKESPYRYRSIEENLRLFEEMKEGKYPDGSKVLRAKIDMNSPNPMLRDPVIYRILHKRHHKTEDKWCIYPMYDWAHGLEDSIEKITHSICTLEFEVHRPLYDWFLNQLEDENGQPIYHPQQIEFARLNISETVLSKRKLLRLVTEGYVNGWDDPRMPTIAAMRRRGITPEAIRAFCMSVGITKRETIRDISIFEKFIRENLNNICPRVMSVLEPLKVVLTNYPEEKVEEITIPNHPKKKEYGNRKVIFSKTLYIEQDDFMEEPTKDFYRLAPDKKVRLKYAYTIKCEKVIKNKKTGKITEIQCTYDPQSKEEATNAGESIKGTIHWLSTENAVKAEMRLYERLFTKEDPLDVEEGKDFIDYLNPNSLQVKYGYVESFLRKEKSGSRYQFERVGYFNIDPKDSKADNLVFNMIISLRELPKKRINS